MNGIPVGIVEVFADDTPERTAAEVITAHGGIVLISVAICFVGEVAFLFQAAYDGGQGIEMRFRIVIESEHFFYKQRAFFPEKSP